MWKKYGTARQAIDDNTMWHMSIAMLDNYGYKLTLRIYNTYSFSMATMVTQSFLNVMLYVHCLSCFLLFSAL